jgi:hypothetical protein
MCVLYPSAVLNFNETVSSGETESIAAEYEMEDFTLKSQFRIRFNVNSLDDFFTKRESLIISTSQDGYVGALCGGRQSPSICRYVGTYDRTYIVYITGAGMPGSGTTTNMLFYYDNTTGEVSTHVDIGPTKGGDEGHHLAAMEITDAGHIICIYDKLNAGGTNHNEALRVMRSSNPEDINSMVEICEIETSSGVSTRCCYPFLFRRTNGDLFVCYRSGEASTNHYKTQISKSTDNGLTWSYTDDIFTIADVHQIWSYAFRGRQLNSHDMYIYVDALDNTDVIHYDHYLLRSSDGDTWYNIDKTFSKNIQTAGLITRIEMDANFLVEHLPAGAATMYQRELAISPDESLCFLVAEYGMDGSPRPYNYYLFYYESGAWVKKQMNGIFDDNEYNQNRAHGLIAYDNNTLDFWCTNKVLGAEELQRWRTTDRGTTWTKVEDITTNSSNGYGWSEITLDSNDNDYLAFFASDRDTSYSDIFLEIYTKLL